MQNHIALVLSNSARLLQKSREHKNSRLYYSYLKRFLLQLYFLLTRGASVTYYLCKFLLNQHFVALSPARL